jgi:uncharacterized membrane protein YkvA (DUF1232 family)
MPISYPPYSLPRNVRQQLRKRLENTQGKPLCSSSQTLLHRKIDILLNSDSTWQADLGLIVGRLLDMHSEAIGSKDDSSSLTGLLEIGLKYFVENDDVIPDMVLEHGYLDDFHFISMCIKKLNQVNPKLVKRYFRIEKGRIVDVEIE